MSRPAAPDVDNTHARKYVPIVFVPGLMGTKLYFGDIDLEAANREGKQALSPRDQEKLDRDRANMWDPDLLGLMSKHWVDASTAEKKNRLLRPAQIVLQHFERGRHSIASSYYGESITGLEGAFDPRAHPLHVVGYDWRKSPKESCAVLKEKIEKLTSKKKCKKVIVVTHSMGGLLARWALRLNPGLESKVAGVIHVAQPVAGVPKLHRTLLAGAHKDWGDGDLTEIVGETDTSRPPDGSVPAQGLHAAHMLSVLPGPMELLPTPQYQLEGAKSWYLMRMVDASFDVRSTLGSFSRVVGFESTDQPIERPAEAYDSTAGEGCFSEAVHDESLRAPLARLGAQVKASHKALGSYKHPRTWSFVCTGQVTDVGTRANVQGGASPKFKGYCPIRTPDSGDGTVPTTSASALFPGEDHEPSDENLGDAQKHQFVFRGIEHAECMNDPRIVRALVTLIRGIASRP